MAKIDHISYGGTSYEIAPAAGDLRDIVAPEFSDQSTYTAGQIVLKNEVLYRFTSDHSGAWTGSDAVVVTVGGEVSDVKTDLSDLESTLQIETHDENLFDPSDQDVLRGQYYDGTTLKTLATLGQTGFIPVETWHYYTSNYRDAFIQVYDENKTYLRKVKSSDFARIGYIQIPADAAYLRFIFQVADEINFKVQEVDSEGEIIVSVPFVKSDVVGQNGINLKFIGGAIRKNDADSPWELISDAYHTPLNISSVSVNSSGNLVIQYSFTARHVISLQVTCDERFAQSYIIGGSVGLNEATFNIYSLSTRERVDANNVYNSLGNFWIFGVMDAFD